MYEQVGVSDPAPRLRNPVVRVVSMETAEAREVVEVPDLSTGLYLLCAELRAPRGLPRVLQSTCFTARVHTSTSQAEQGRYWTHKIKVLYLTIPDLNNTATMISKATVKAVYLQQMISMSHLPRNNRHCCQLGHVTCNVSPVTPRDT